MDVGWTIITAEQLDIANHLYRRQYELWMLVNGHALLCDTNCYVVLIRWLCKQEHFMCWWQWRGIVLYCCTISINWCGRNIIIIIMTYAQKYMMSWRGRNIVMIIMTYAQKYMMTWRGRNIITIIMTYAQKYITIVTYAPHHNAKMSTKRHRAILASVVQTKQ